QARLRGGRQIRNIPVRRSGIPRWQDYEHLPDRRRTAQPLISLDRIEQGAFPPASSLLYSETGNHNEPQSAQAQARQNSPKRIGEGKKREPNEKEIHSPIRCV